MSVERRNNTNIVIDLRGVECQVQTVALDFLGLGIQPCGVAWLRNVAHGGDWWWW